MIANTMGAVENAMASAPQGTPALARAGANAGGGLMDSLKNLSPEAMQMVGGGVSSSLAGINKLIGTMLLLSENAKNREVEGKEFQNNVNLTNKAMTMQYLLGNKDYRNQLNSLMVNMTNKKRKRAIGDTQSSGLDAAQNYGR